MRVGESLEIVTGQTGAQAFCMNCGSELGSKFVRKFLTTLKSFNLFYATYVFLLF